MIKILFLVFFLTSCTSFGAFDLSQPLISITEEKITQPEPEKMSWDIYEPSVVAGQCHVVYLTASSNQMDEVLKDETVILAIKKYYYTTKIVESDEYFNLFASSEIPALIFFDPNGFIIHFFENQVDKIELLAFLFDSAHDEICFYP